MENNEFFDKGYDLVVNTLRHEPDIMAAVLVEAEGLQDFASENQVEAFVAGATQAIHDLP